MQLFLKIKILLAFKAAICFSVLFKLSVMNKQYFFKISKSI